MISYTITRTALLVPLLFGIVIVVFGLMQLIPGDPAVVLLGQDATPEAVAEMRRALGLDRPVAVQFFTYVTHLVQGDLGTSIFRNEPVLDAIASRFPATLEIAVVALLITVVIGIPLGTWAAVRRGSFVDKLNLVFAQVGVSMPVFWVGILLMFFLAVQLDLFPAVGRGEPLLNAVAAAFAGEPAVLARSLSHIALPALTLGISSAAITSRVVRASMLETLQAPYTRLASAKGVSRSRVLLAHALRTALLPVVNVLGLRFGELLGGAVLTESIFGWPGLGQLTVTAISQRDIPLVQGTVLVFALLFALVNLAVDLLNASIDPRTRVNDRK